MSCSVKHQHNHNRLSISGSNGSVICSVTGFQKTVTKCSIKANLQQYKNGSWVTIATWQQSYNDYYGFLTGTKALTKGYDYRTQAIYTATSASGTETLRLSRGHLRFVKPLFQLAVVIRQALVAAVVEKQAER